MSTYNNTMVETISSVMTRLLDTITRKDESHRVLELASVKLPDATSDISIEDLGQLVNDFTIQFTIKVTNPDGGSYIIETQLTAPLMIKNIFFIKGKRRISTNVLTNSGICVIYKNNIVFDDNRAVKLLAKDPYVWDPKLSLMQITDKDGEVIEFYVSDDDKFIQYKELLKLNDDLKYRLNVKLDTDDVGDYISPDLIRMLVMLGPDIKRDSIVDKTIMNIEKDFNHYLNFRTQYKKISSSAMNSFFRYGTIRLSAFQSAINTYFNTAQSECLEIPSSINPLVYDSLRYKLRIPANIMYNRSFTDLIDPSNTPENNNVNQLNELNVCASIENGVIYITCYDFTSGDKMKVPYLKYLNKKVLRNDCYDYDKHQILDVDELHYKLRLIDRVAPNDGSIVFDYVEPKADEKLSPTLRRIPLINMSDSVRVSMGSSMIRQAVHTAGSEPRLVESGNDEEDYENSTNLISYNSPQNSDAKVVEVNQDHVLLQDLATNSIISVDVPEPVKGANESLSPYKPIVHEGDIVKPNQVIITPVAMKNKTYDLGVNARTVYMSYLGYSYEDGVIISESYAKKCTHYSSIDLSIAIKSDYELRGLMVPGSEVRCGEILMSTNTTLRARESTTKAIRGKRGDNALGSISREKNEMNLLVPNNIDEGYVVDMKVTPNPKISKLEVVEYTQKLIKEWYETPKNDAYLELPDYVRDLKAQTPTDFEPNDAYIVTFKIIKVNRMKIGDKSSNSWGGKGIISLILPDELMPRPVIEEHADGTCDFGEPFEIIMNPAAVVARKNPSQLYECALTKVIKEVYEVTKNQLKYGEFNTIRKWLRQYYGNRFDNYSDEQLLEASKSISNFSMKVGSYAKISYEQVVDWMDGLGLKETDLVYVPDVVIYQAPYEVISDAYKYNRGTLACTPEYAKEHGIKGKLYELGFTEGEVITGQEYMYKLYHAADYVGKVTPEKTYSKDPLMHRGIYRGEGQKIGEMESWALKSYGAEELVTMQNPDIKRGEHRFLNELLITGFLMTDSDGRPLGY